MNYNTRSFFTGLITSLAMSSPLLAQNALEVPYFGVCDGSAAILLSPDTLLVANDETNSLASYHIAGGQVIAERSLDPLLDLPDGVDEIDIEATARRGDQIWWIGSHGLNKNENQRPNRRSFFATNIPDTDLGNLQILEAPTDLLDVLLASALTAPLFTPEILRSAPKEGGINIEGMTFDDAGQLVLGFRSPLLGGDALLISLSMPAAEPAVRSAHILNLNGRGIRDLAYHNHEFYILAGSAGTGGTPAFYRWDGHNALVEIPAMLDGLNPEALIRVENGWIILSDDGTVKRPFQAASDGDRKCKKIFDDDDPLQDQHHAVFFRGILVSDQ